MKVEKLLGSKVTQPYSGICCINKGAGSIVEENWKGSLVTGGAEIYSKNTIRVVKYHVTLAIG